MNKIHLKWDYSSGKIERQYEDINNFGFIDINKLPQITNLLIEQYNTQREYIKLLHDKIDSIIEHNNICSHTNCHTAGCTSDHK